MSSNCGSSPLAQGTLGSRGRGGNASWLIPARAGNIEGQEYASPFHPAHPRSHGEHREYPPGFFAGFGSSPLARRTHLRMIPNPLHRRLIPARAGNNGRANPSPTPGPAHPRSCGEHVPARAGNTHFSRLRVQPVAAHPRLRGEHKQNIVLHRLAPPSTPRHSSGQRHQR